MNKPVSFELAKLLKEKGIKIESSQDNEIYGDCYCKNMKELLEKVINGESLYVDLPFTPIKEIEKVLKELGVITKNVDADTNGWEIDFWYVYENQYQLSGSLHYGELKFSKV